MPDNELKAGDPYCTNCGYALTGAVDSSRCPECGRPLVEVMDRFRPKLKYAGRRYRSTTMLMGLPLIDIALGPVDNEPKGKARGFIAIGDEATGWLAIGGMARGVVAIGGMAVGVFSAGGMSIGLGGAVGGCAIGGLAAGGCAIGGLAGGGGAAGIVAQGGAAVGYYARGGGAFGPNTIGGGGPTSQEAVDVFNALSWFFSANWPSPTSIGLPFMMVGMIIIVAALTLAALAWLKWSRHGGEG